MLMKRFHVHVAVSDIEQSVKFYTTFFNSEPAVKKEDYAKWMLDDPRINFAISNRGREPGLDHLGIQVDDEESLKEISLRLKDAQEPILEQEQTTCCYAKSDKTWVHDPQGIAWESFYTIGSATTYGEDADFEQRQNSSSACCAPSSEEIPISFISSKKDCSK
jgi:catechol 2,3-dioxygenase-like lactoylglutathione lyase family enzyme